LPGAKVRLFLHIGLHKTGSSAIQHGLYGQCDRLESQNYSYPRPAEFEAHHKLAFIALRAPGESFASQRQRFSDAATALREQATRENVIVSSEMLAEQVDWHLLPVFREVFEEVKVIIYLRRQDLLFESAYNQRVKRNCSPC